MTYFIQWKLQISVGHIIVMMWWNTFETVYPVILFSCALCVDKAQYALW